MQDPGLLLPRSHDDDQCFLQARCGGSCLAAERGGRSAVPSALGRMRAASIDGSGCSGLPGDVLDRFPAAAIMRRSMTAVTADADPDAENRAAVRRSTDLAGRRASADCGEAGEDSSPRKKNLFKTELCRSYEETRSCKYGVKCQVRVPDE